MLHESFVRSIEGLIFIHNRIMRYEVAIKGCSKASPTYESYEDGTIKGLSLFFLLVNRVCHSNLIFAFSGYSISVSAKKKILWSDGLRTAFDGNAIPEIEEADAMLFAFFYFERLESLEVLFLWWTELYSPLLGL